MERECMSCKAQLPACGEQMPVVVATSDGGLLQFQATCSLAPLHRGQHMHSCGPACPCRPEGGVHPIGCGVGAARVSSGVCEVCAKRGDGAIFG